MLVMSFEMLYMLSSHQRGAKLMPATYCTPPVYAMSRDVCGVRILDVNCTQCHNEIYEFELYNDAIHSSLLIAGTSILSGSTESMATDVKFRMGMDCDQYAM